MHQLPNPVIDDEKVFRQQAQSEINRRSYVLGAIIPAILTSLGSFMLTYKLNQCSGTIEPTINYFNAFVINISVVVMIAGIVAYWERNEQRHLVDTLRVLITWNVTFFLLIIPMTFVAIMMPVVKDPLFTGFAAAFGLYAFGDVLAFTMTLHFLRKIWNVSKEESSTGESMVMPVNAQEVQLYRVLQELFQQGYTQVPLEALSERLRLPIEMVRSLIVFIKATHVVPLGFDVHTGNVILASIPQLSSQRKGQS